ncbi:MAG TPA: hypothetical protein VE907_15640 [Gammaproteobacteria bacterium]|nr:hypothetical protein [Gammaproteobacteria bacterium]
MRSATDVDPAVEATLPRITHHHTLPSDDAALVKLRTLIGGVYARRRSGSVVAIVCEVGVLPVSKSTFLRSVAAGRVRGIRRGSATYYRAGDIRNLLEQLRGENESASDPR